MSQGTSPVSAFGSFAGIYAKKPEWPKPDPVIFTNVGLAPDMSIEVFKQIFHVNSLVLKVHSHYFRSYLDSPDKTSAPAGDFKYTWVTQVDSDGNGWSLTAKEKGTDFGKAYTGNPDEQIFGWHCLLHTLHDWPLQIVDVKQLCLLTELADFYRMLPAISNAISARLLNYSALSMSIPENCVILLEAAFKLRNEVLFRECFVHVMGPWTTPRYHQLKTAKLKELAADTHTRFLQQLVHAQFGLVALTVPSPSGNAGQRAASTKFGTDLAAIAVSRPTDIVSAGRVTVPSYYRTLNSHNFGISGSVQGLLRPLLYSALVLDRSGVRSGEGMYKDSFLCFNLTTSQLPWDVNQRSW